MKQNAEKQLLKLFAGLDPEAQGHLLAFAEYLASKQPARPAVASEPVSIEAGPDESVIQAIKRLSQCYPMLERSRLLNDTSALMTQHMLHGRERLEIIQELEVVFAKHYQQYLDENKDGP